MFLQHEWLMKIKEKRDIATLTYQMQLLTVINSNSLMNSFLIHLFPMHLFLLYENIKRPYGFQMFSGGRERVYWEQMS